MAKAVFLDIDGTLMDTNDLHIEAWAQAFEEVGARPPRSRIHHEVGKGSDKLIPEFVEDGKAERVSDFHSEYYGKLQRFQQWNGSAFGFVPQGEATITAITAAQGSGSRSNS